VVEYPDLKALRILHYPHARLRRKARAMPAVDAFLNEMAARMAELMQAAGGLGLASTQVGWPFRFVVLTHGVGTDEIKIEAFVNPVIIARDGKQVIDEGCLSLPGIFAKVKRAEHVRVQAAMLNGEQVEFEAEGLMARAWQHEIDHLDGGLIIDRIGPTAGIVIARQLRELEQQFEEENAGKTKPLSGENAAASE